MPICPISDYTVYLVFFNNTITFHMYLWLKKQSMRSLCGDEEWGDHCQQHPMIHTHFPSISHAFFFP